MKKPRTAAVEKDCSSILFEKCKEIIQIFGLVILGAFLSFFSVLNQCIDLYLFYERWEKYIRYSYNSKNESKGNMLLNSINYLILP